MSDAILRQISGDVREMRGDVKTLLVAMGNHEGRISSLENVEKKDGWIKRWMDFFLEAPKLIHVLLLAGTLITALWGVTHGWLVAKLDSEKGTQPVAHVGARDRIQEHGK